MKTIKMLAQSGILLLFFFYYPASQVSGIRPGNNSLFLQKRDERLKTLFPDQRFRPEPEVLVKQINHSALKSGSGFKCRLENLVIHYWDPASGKWEANFRQEYRYDQEGNMTECKYFSLDPWSNKWNALKKESYTYLAKGILSSYISYNWYSEGSRWIPEYRKDYSYNNTNYLIRSSWFTWDFSTNSWNETNKLEYQNNPLGITTRTVVYRREGTTDQWKETVKDEFYYDNYGNLMQFITYNWVANTNSWKATNKREYEFDEKGNRIQTLYYQWSDVSKWSAAYREDYHYDAAGNMITFKGYIKDETADKWIERYKEENNYCNDFCLCDLILPFNDNESRIYFRHQLTDIREYDMNSVTGKWDSSNKIVFNYVMTSNSTLFVIPDSEVQLFPNPVTDCFSVQWPEQRGRYDITLYTLKGEKAFSGWIKNGENIPVTGWRPGVYLYRLNAGKKQRIGKLVIR